MKLKKELVKDKKKDLTQIGLIFETNDPDHENMITVQKSKHKKN
jgi:hypothetical protein